MPRVAWISLLLAFASTTAWGAPLAPAPPQKAYFGVNRPIRVNVESPGDRPQATLEIALFDFIADGGEGARPVELAREPVEAGEADLAALFPILWTELQTQTRVAQLVADGAEVGAPLILQPIVNPAIPIDASVPRFALEAFDARDRDAVSRVFDLESNTRLALAPDPWFVIPSDGVVLSGYRVFPAETLVFRTSKGDIRVRLRPDMAPNTAWHIRELVKHGFYEDIRIHRVAPMNEAGHPFVIQFGDPTGMGGGGSGMYIDLEQSTLPHDFGVVSVARTREINTNGAQIFICLSREACRVLDGGYTSFGQVVGSPDAVLAIERAENVNNAPREDIFIETAFTEPAAPFSAWAAPTARPLDEDSR